MVFCHTLGWNGRFWQPRMTVHFISTLQVFNRLRSFHFLRINSWLDVVCRAVPFILRHFNHWFHYDLLLECSPLLPSSTSSSIILPPLATLSVCTTPFWSELLPATLTCPVIMNVFSSIHIILFFTLHIDGLNCRQNFPITRLLSSTHINLDFLHHILMVWIAIRITPAARTFTLIIYWWSAMSSKLRRWLSLHRRFVLMVSIVIQFTPIALACTVITYWWSPMRPELPPSLVSSALSTSLDFFILHIYSLHCRPSYTRRFRLCHIYILHCGLICPHRWRLLLNPHNSLFFTSHIDGLHGRQNEAYRWCLQRYYILMVCIMVRTTPVAWVFSFIHIIRFFSHRILMASIVVRAPSIALHSPSLHIGGLHCGHNYPHLLRFLHFPHPSFFYIRY